MNIEEVVATITIGDSIKAGTGAKAETSMQRRSEQVLTYIILTALAIVVTAYVADYIKRKNSFPSPSPL